MKDWLNIERGDVPLIVSFPHAGTEIPDDLMSRFVSPWLARRDTDWWVHELYGFVHALGATTVRTEISRSVIDVNRDPSGVSLYPGHNTTGLCPLTTFDNQPLYREGFEPGVDDIRHRRECWFEPYHAALREEIMRLRRIHPVVVVYDAHSIRSKIGYLFDGELPQFNIGTAGVEGIADTSCSNELADQVERLCAQSGLGYVRNGRFKGGYITRHYSDVTGGVHTLQMELACRGYMREPDDIDESNWPSAYDPKFAAPLQETLRKILQACLNFAISWKNPLSHLWERVPRRGGRGRFCCCL